MMKNFSYFCLGLLISVGLFFVPYANAQVNYTTPGGTFPTQVLGPTSWLPDNFFNPSANSGRTATVTANSSGASISNGGFTEIKTYNGQKILVPTSAVANLNKASIARAARLASRFLGPVGVALSIKDIYEESGLQICPAPHFFCKPSALSPNMTELGWNSVYSSNVSLTTAIADAIHLSNFNNNVTDWKFDKLTVLTGNKTADIQVWRTNSQGTRVTMVHRSTRTTAADVSLNPGLPYSDSELEQAFLEKMDAEPEFAKRYLDAVQSDRGKHPFIPNPIDGDTPITVNAPPVTGPERTTGITTKNNPDGSVDTTTTKEQVTVNPKSTGTNISNTTISYPTTTVTTSTTVNNVTNATTTVTNTTENINEESEEDKDDSFSDTAMPELPELYEQKYPDGIAGVWRDNKPNIQGTQFWQGISSMFPNFSGGQCPAWSMSFNILPGANFGSMPFDVPCWIWQAIGLIMMTTAAFTARKIIF